MTACEHMSFEATVRVARLVKDGDDPHSEVEGYSADLSICCADCGEQFGFIGGQVGVDPRQPTVSGDGLELRAPICPRSADVAFGLGLPAVRVRLRATEEPTN